MLAVLRPVPAEGDRSISPACNEHTSGTNMEDMKGRLRAGVQYSGLLDVAQQWFISGMSLSQSTMVHAVDTKRRHVVARSSFSCFFP